MLAGASPDTVRSARGTRLTVVTATSTPEAAPRSTRPAEVEARRYRLWEERGLLHRRRVVAPSPAFSIVIPPPNVTGSLHIGHALDHTLIDALVRRRRMQGYNALWLPGMDHAGIATQNVVERELAKEGLTRHDLGREAFVERVWQWKAESGGAILGQMRAARRRRGLDPRAVHHGRRACPAPCRRSSSGSSTTA